MVRYLFTASPSVSKPGPKFDVEAGTTIFFKNRAVRIKLLLPFVYYMIRVWRQSARLKYNLYMSKINGGRIESDREKLFSIIHFWLPIDIDFHVLRLDFEIE